MFIISFFCMYLKKLASQRKYKNSQCPRPKWSWKKFASSTKLNKSTCTSPENKFALLHKSLQYISHTVRTKTRKVRAKVALQRIAFGHNIRLRPDIETQQSEGKKSYVLGAFPWSRRLYLFKATLYNYTCVGEKKDDPFVWAAHPGFVTDGLSLPENFFLVGRRTWTSQLILLFFVRYFYYDLYCLVTFRSGVIDRDELFYRVSWPK